MHIKRIELYIQDDCLLHYNNFLMGYQCTCAIIEACTVPTKLHVYVRVYLFKELVPPFQALCVLCAMMHYF